MNKKTKIILWILSVAIVAGLAYFYIHNNSSTSSKKINITTPNGGNIVVDVSKNATSTKSSENSKSNTSDKGYTIKILPPSAYPDNPKSTTPIPDLNKKLTFGNNISKEAKDIITKKINTFEDALKKNSKSFEDWMGLGMYRKIEGDYVGASQAWEYAGVIDPKNSLSFRNLGDLYGYYLKDNKNAEKNFLEAIKNGPTQIEYYFKTANFYIEIENDKTKAIQIVQQGIKSNPDSKALKSFLITLQ